jgi:acyl carrier protein
MSRALKLDTATAQEITEETTAADLPAWTSVTHLSLILELEQAFNVQFDNQEIASLGSVSAMSDALARKCGQTSNP